MSDTPETDAAQHEGLLRTNPIPIQVVTANFARNLERERDEARKKIERQRERIAYLEGATHHACGTPLSKAIKERDEWAKLCGQYKQERDEAREQRDSLQALSQSLAETCVKLKAERDEARAELTRHGWRLTS